MQCENVPLLLLAGSIALVRGCIAAAEELIKRGGISSFKVSGGACVFEAFGGNGFWLTVFPAVLMINPIEAANLSCIWLGGAIVLGQLAVGRRLSIRHGAGILCFCAGVLVMVMDGIAAGHVLALCGGLIWGWYVMRIAVGKGGGRGADAVGNLLVGAGLIYLSLMVEGPWRVGPSDVFWLCGLIFAENIGFLLWMYGDKYGAYRKAKISVLFMPVGAVLWICVLGGLRLEMDAVIATAAVTIAGLLLSEHVLRAARVRGP